MKIPYWQHPIPRIRKTLPFIIALSVSRTAGNWCEQERSGEKLIESIEQIDLPLKRPKKSLFLQLIQNFPLLLKDSIEARNIKLVLYVDWIGEIYNTREL
jgi:hypothetical protein